MTKIIHCIKVGSNAELGDFELSCVESWKRVYPDFEIKYWTDKELIPFINTCRYAVSCYNNRMYAFAGDYARLMILYEYGGLYMDTDVFCKDRIPDHIFEKSFTAWDAGFDTYWSQNGTCLYAANPKEELFGKMVAYYQGFKEYPEFAGDNTTIEHFLRKELPIDWKNRMICQVTNQDLGDIVIYNCAQFGAFDYNQSLLWALPNDIPVYLVHARTKSWQGYIDENIYLYYAFINKDTDMMKLYDAVHDFKDMKLNNPNCKAVLALGLNTLNSDINWISRWLKMNLSGNKSYIIAPLGIDLDYDTLNASFLDYITKRYNKIKFCRDILDESFDGTLHI